MKRLLLLAALVVAALSTGACEPVPGRVAWTGDSVSFNSGYNDSTSYINQVDNDGKIVIGGRASDTLARVQADVAGQNTSPQCLVIAFGQNEAGDGVVTQDEKNALFAMVYAAHSSARVVVIKPHREHGPSNVMAAIEEVRGVLDTLVSSRSNTAVLDWRERALPGYIAVDGVHLAPDNVEAAHAYGELGREGCNA